MGAQLQEKLTRKALVQKRNAEIAAAEGRRVAPRTLLPGGGAAQQQLLRWGELNFVYLRRGAGRHGGAPPTGQSHGRRISATAIASGAWSTSPSLSL